ncbi:serine/arginine repetitive matrix protein 2 isoform X2 [Nasonia vitripennis]|uniref:Uncharacterized protein n=1 Tax=Nasonia vitripennis TaxID=7425 RepID=A0A7M7IM99_NASVI|nr:serine/arginine repetitive matrix protein 2 isoform X2 [Nasonia vitripennis]
MEVISTRRYEVRPPADSHASILLDPANAVATVKEEEWETRKKKEITTTRQIETRVKRQVVLEDGEVVVDSGPLVTTNTTEDVEQQEHTTQERRTTGDEPQKLDWPADAKPGAVVQKELNETIVKSREEIEELLETEDRQQLGDITDEAYLQAVRNNRGDLRVALAESKRQLSGPRVLQHTTRSNKVVDTEKTLERSELKQDGQIVTERKTTVEHEEIKDDELPEGLEDEAREVRKEASQRYVKTRDEDIVDYVKPNGERLAREMRFVSVTTEAERTGEWPPEAPASGIRSGRLHGKHEKQNSQQVRAKSPVQYIVERTRESSRSNGHGQPSVALENARNHKESHSSSYSRRHQEHQQQRPKADPPSPPMRRKAKEQPQVVTSSRTERSYQETLSPPRAASPVHVVQRTWESRNRDVQQEDRRGNGRGNHDARVIKQEYVTSSSRRRTPDPESRSPSPRRDKKEHARPSKSPSPSKYKIGESFRKLVGKLRSASSERRGNGNKRPGSSSTSQLTQTEDNSSTYLQYNSVDRNIPLGPEYDRDVTDDRGRSTPPERPPRSPRNPNVASSMHNLSSATSSSQKYKNSRSSSPRLHKENRDEYARESNSHVKRESSAQPIHRYYLGEDPFGSIYGKEKGYREAKLHSRHRRPIDEEYSNEPSSLGRFSKSTSRLANDYELNERHERMSAQTLPRKIHNSSSQSRSQQQQQQQQQQHSTTTKTTTTTTTSRRQMSRDSSSPVSRYQNGYSSQESPSRQYGSMINISFKNHVNTSPQPKTTHFVQTTINTQPPPVPPKKPERTYKSTLSRSKSFNVEIADDGLVSTPKTNSYSNGNNIRSTSQLNRLDESPPPLKSPGILASISRSNRDLMMRNGKHEY